MRTPNYVTYILVCLGLALVGLTQAQTQTPLSNCFRQFSIDDGLRSDQIFSVLQDQRGYMWFATNKGVNVYNGHTFKSYTTKNGLKDNSILTLHEDYKGRIWFASYTGEISYVQHDSLFQLAIPKEWKGWKTAMVPSKLFVTQDDTLWIGMESGAKSFLKVSIEDPTVYSFPIKSYVDSDIKLFSDGSIVHSRSKSMRSQRIIDSENQIHVIAQLNPNRKLNSSSETFFADEQGIYLSSQGKLLRWQNGTVDTLLTFHEKANVGLLKDQDNNLFIPIIPLGVLWYKPNAYHLPPDTLLPNELVTSIVRDHEGGYWFGTHSSGAFYTSSLASLCLTRKPKKGNQRLKRISANGNKILQLRHDNSMASIELNEARVLTEKVLSNTVRNFNWLNDSLIHLFRPPEITPKIAVFNVLTNRDSPKSLPFNIAQVTFLNEHKKCVRLTLRGIDAYDLKTQKTDTLLRSPARRWFAGISYQGKVWCSDHEGIWTLSNDSLIHPFTDDVLNQAKALSFHVVNNLLTIATEGFGVIVVDSTHKVWMLNEQNGLSSDFCSGLASDASGSLWVATNKGITQFLDFGAKTSLKTNYFLEKNDLVSKDIEEIFLVEDRIWAFSGNGLSIIPTNESPSSNRTLSHIESVMIGDSLVDPHDHLYLSYNESKIRIEYAALTYKHPALTTFKFRLLGTGDTNWTTTQTHALEFPQLSPGSYLFQVAATGVNVGPISSFSFTIYPPFWLEWWFLLLSALVAIAIATTLIMLQIQRIKKMASLQTAMLISEQKALRAQINPHFIFNAINSILALISRKENDRADEALHQFAALMRNTLTYSELQLIPLEDEVYSITQYLELEHLRFDQGFSYEITTNGIDLGQIEIPPMIIQPFIENAVKHGLLHKPDGQGKLLISFSMEDHVLTCVVDDNGIGREASNAIYEQENFQTNGSGIKITANRIDLVNQTSPDQINLEIIDKTDSDNNSEGTKVVITFTLDDL